jgi:hypothetical protein
MVGGPVRYVQLDPRLTLHPRIINLSDGGFRAFIEAWFFLAANPDIDFIPTRFVKPRGARELRESGLMSQDGGAYRLTISPESGPDYPEMPRIVDGLGSQELVPASKPKGSKALALEGVTLVTFERFWKAFGLKSGRKEAFVAWQKVIKNTDPELIIDAADRHRRWFEEHPDPPKRKYAQGWLNGRRWEDVLPPYPNPNGRQRDAAMETLERAQALREEGR